jgi:hypothetical protein
VSGYDFLESNTDFGSDKEKAKGMYQNAVIYAVHHPRFYGRKPTIAFMAEGPYAIPVVKQ